MTIATFSLVASAWTSTRITGVRARASSTSSSITSNIATAGERKSEPITLITATLVPSSAAATVSPRPGRRRDVRGPDHPLGGLEVAVDLGAPPGVVAERDHVCACGEHPGGELGRDPDAVGEVLAVDDAERGAELFAQPAQPLLDGPTPGAPTTSPTKRIFSEPRARPQAHRQRHVVARILRVAGECLALDGCQVDDDADLRSRLRDRGADRQRRVGAEVCERDDDRRRGVGRMSIRAPYVPLASTKSVIPTTVPSTGA